MENNVLLPDATDLGYEQRLKSWWIVSSVSDVNVHTLLISFHNCINLTFYHVSLHRTNSIYNSNRLI